ncbi:MAG TPA: ABC transporter ATP-binding protein [Ferrovibrio sp.]|jgi:branched-chain amino acid transport system ATP-binding protein|uniref:ABC transporter ATP-binding protein n=1 Tax=Ferrovibrio sp. TaxID=1917215 RepID=UPI002B4AFD33|nr:ABC transporter ATP-binding protein [Ferrovibrio sp.]HLT76172.1 ABC transporter ATP-binding protein [Ferrovibrio sp.]
MLEVRGLRAGYGEVEVLRGVDLDVAKGEIVALLGANGAGKSTLNNNLSGIYAPRAGRVVFMGKDITAAGSDRIVDAGLIQVPEGRRVFPNLSVQENLELGSYRRGKGRRVANLERVYGIFPRLKERMNQPAGTLSGGEQQMLAIGRGLMTDPELLILDEPSLGLSPLLVEEMFGLVRQLNRDGLPILLVEQNVVQSLAIAHRAFVLEHGTIAMSGPASVLLNDPGLKASYLGL